MIVLDKGILDRFMCMPVIDIFRKVFEYFLHDLTEELLFSLSGGDEIKFDKLFVELGPSLLTTLFPSFTF